MMAKPSIVSVDRLELTFMPKPWAFAVERRGEIDAHFAALQRAKPALWNGRVLLLHEHTVADGVLRGAYLETDYASFAAWCAWGRPEAGVADCFGAAAIVAADGAVLLGVMGPHTFNAGCIYFPCGTPDPDDIVGNCVDLEQSMRRELTEETGLDPADFAAEPGWTSIADGPLLVQIKLLRSHDSADVLLARARAHLARERQPELADLRIVRGPHDFDPAMPRFVTAFLARYFGRCAPSP
jgi:8-oxo-dGTP pyrophosphatase MutT (NUDIX family)